MTTFETAPGWRTNPSPENDFAAIWLDSPVDRARIFVPGVYDDFDLQQQWVCTAGYPYSPGAAPKQLYFDTDCIQGSSKQLLYYSAQTSKGQSGSPIWTYLEEAPDAEPVVVAIHSRKKWDTHSSFNFGPRITQQIYEWIDERRMNGL